MRRFLVAAFLLLAASCAYSQAPANYTEVVGSNITDAAGNKLASGTITFQPTNSSGAPISFRVGGGGQAISRAAQTTVTNGAFSITLADVSLSSPTYFCYQVTVTDNVSGAVVLGGPDYSCIQPNGAVYSLDNYSTSTTPIVPPANAQFNGNLGLNGNLTITGNIYGNIGTLVTTQINAANETVSNMLTASISNGVINPMGAAYTGTDLGARINDVFATTCYGYDGFPNHNTPECTIQIPPGVYSVTTGIVLPPAESDITIIATGAVLNFQPGVAYGLASGVSDDHVLFYGGTYNFAADPNVKAGVVLAYGSQGAFLTNMKIVNLPAADGILDLGTNVGTILNTEVKNALIGTHLLGSPGFASNNIKILGSLMDNNVLSGIVDGDISQYPVGWPIGNGMTWATSGVSSQNKNNMFLGNDLEGNNTGGFGWPDVLIALAQGDVIRGNYFESTAPIRVQVGCCAAGAIDSPPNSYYNVMYGTSMSNGGTASGTQIRENYNTENSVGSTFYIYAGIETTIEGNTDAGGSTTPCYINLGFASHIAWINNNAAVASSKFCIGGNPVTADAWTATSGANLSELPYGTIGSSIFFETDGTGSTLGRKLTMDAVGPPSAANPSNPAGIYTCNPAWKPGTIWTDGTLGAGWFCEADSALPVPSSDGNDTFTRVMTAQPINGTNACTKLGAGAICYVSTLPSGSCTTAQANTMDFAGSGVAICNGSSWTAH